MMRRSLFLVPAAICLLFGAGCSQSKSPAVEIPSAPVPAATSTSEAVAPNPVPMEDQAAAVVYDVTGKAAIVRNGEFVVAVPKMELRAGDMVSVSSTGSLTIAWPNYGRTIVDGGSSIELSEASEAADQSHFIIRLKLQAGRIWTRLERLLGSDSRFSVRADTTVATVRGTSFGVALKGKKVKVQVMESHVGVFRVQDRPPTSEELLNGASTSSVVEEPMEVGVEVGPKEQVEATTDGASMSKPLAMSATDQKDSFISAGNAPVPQDVMAPSADQGATSPANASSMPSIGIPTPTNPSQPASPPTRPTISPELAPEVQTPVPVVVPEVPPAEPPQTPVPVVVPPPSDTTDTSSLVDPSANIEDNLQRF